MNVTKGVDVVVWLKLVRAAENRTEQQLAGELGLSQATVHRAIRQGEKSRIVSIPGRRSRGNVPHVKRVNKRALFELVAYGVPYVFPGALGRVTRGMATAGSAPVLASHFAEDVEPVVWPDAKGESRGAGVEPLHACVPEASRRDPELYVMLALVDALRVGRARERKLARVELERRLL